MGPHMIESVVVELGLGFLFIHITNFFGIVGNVTNTTTEVLTFLGLLWFTIIKKYSISTYR